MRYFTKEAEEKFILNNDKEEWLKNTEDYWKQFNQFANKFPPMFIKEYRKECFHDYEIISINWIPNVQKKKQNAMLELQLKYDSIINSLRYLNVTKFNIKTNIVQQYSNNNFEYDEILQISDKTFSHEITFGVDNILYVEFSKIQFHKRHLSQFRRI